MTTFLHNPIHVLVLGWSMGLFTGWMARIVWRRGTGKEG